MSSPDSKASNLYILGRCMERFYLRLHLLTKFDDLLQEGREEECAAFLRNLENEVEYESPEALRIGLLFDDTNCVTVAHALRSAREAAATLRDTIISEALTFIQRAEDVLHKASRKEFLDPTDVRTLKDLSLAFWGSVGERIYDRHAIVMMKIGRLVEHIEMNIRFDYRFYRIREAFDELLFIADLEGKEEIFDTLTLDMLKRMLSQREYNTADPDYKNAVLHAINILVQQ
ncbi:MAG: alpha-E domain-containing protein [Bacteroidales bacterium]|nr:alpha-E domain-containing protein [Bacteroidales bacterium]